MKSQNDINDYLDVHTSIASDEFHREISTDENKDYRRGFRAGVLFAYLHARSNIGSIEETPSSE